MIRSILFIVAAFASNAPAVAQSWEDYSYPEYAISVAFPAHPNIEITTDEGAVRFRPASNWFATTKASSNGGR